MRRSSQWLLGVGAAGLIALLTGALATAETRSDVIVHEWGTFLAMQGSDGVTLDGMYHEEHALPGFVHARSRDQLRLRGAIVKGETPVIYFYTRRPQRIAVAVDFPTGIWTQWYPQASTVAPTLAQTASPPETRNGRITWYVNLIPDGTASPALPRIADGALWGFARDVSAAYVTNRDGPAGGGREAERFIFYRGLGTSPLPLTMTASGGGTLRWTDPRMPSPRHLFVLRVEKGRGVYRYLPGLQPGDSAGGVIPTMEGAEGARPLAEFTEKIGNELADRLIESGLYTKEARAMVNTWRSSYFHSDGIRVLFILPQAWTDAAIPMRVSPPPAALVRVMVGRLELLTPEREQRAESAVRELASTDSATRDRAFAYLRDQGRYVEPILKRVVRTSSDGLVRNLCKRLLLTGFVTDLRTATREEVTGEPAKEQPAHVRAQLASLLREVGLESEAKEEGRKALEGLRRLPAPPMDHSVARHHLRAYARAEEGLGNDAAAVERYAAFIRFAAQAKTDAGCRGCHAIGGADGPRDMGFFRDWWAGRRYAELAVRSGRAAEEIRDAAAAAGDTTARLKLVYLYERTGRKDKAEPLWAALGASPTRTARSE